MGWEGAFEAAAAQQQEQLRERSQLWHIAVPKERSQLWLTAVPRRGPSSASRAWPGSVPQSICQTWLSMATAVGLDAREDDAEGEGGRKSGL